MSSQSFALTAEQFTVRPRSRAASTRWTPDPKRVLAIAAAVSAHILVFGAMLLPSERGLVARIHPGPELTFETPSLPPPPTLPVVVKITPKAPTVPELRPQPAPQPELKLEAPPVQVAVLPVPMEDAEQVSIAEPARSGGASAVESVMQVVRAPAPPYPIDLIRKGVSGTVEFRVLVNADGMPEQVELLRSSGNRKLDQLSLSHIKRRWRFRAPEVDGVARAGWGRGKVSFALEQ